MGTSCYLKAKTSDNKWSAIYVNFDSYPSYMMPLLNNHFNTQERIDAMMALGNLSFLHENLEPHIGDHRRQQNGTTAKHRDLDDDLIIAKADTLDELEPLLDYLVNYCYIYENNEWKQCAKPA